MKIPESIRQFVDAVAELPGVGPRQAIRLAFFFTSRGPEFNDLVARGIASLKELVPCSRCFYPTKNGGGICAICSNAERRKELIAIVEKETDLISIESTGQFSGQYLVLGDLKKNGVLDTEQKLRLGALKERIRRELSGSAEEIIIAVSPTTHGDLNAELIGTEVAPFAKKVSRLGRGIPTGGEIEFADYETLKEAIARRS